MNRYQTHQNRLLRWYYKNKRDLPWRNSKDPYKIYLSEIILQQTRINQGLEYYVRFVKHFPTIGQLASSAEDEVLKCWQGLGYYSRARNMLKAAKIVMQDFQGRFPSDYFSLLRLPGVGPYTAAAVSSIAANQPVAVVDGNVARVLSRLFLYKSPVNSTKGKKDINELADHFLMKKKAGDYNQALMELGALVCTPKNPTCRDCPFQLFCLAYKQKEVDAIPVKEKKTKQRKRYFYYFWLENEQHILMRQRQDGDVWQGLYEPLLIETKEQINEKMLAKLLNQRLGNNFVESLGNLDRWEKKHVLTHQIIHAVFYRILLSGIQPIDGYHPYPVKDFEKLPVARLVEEFHQQYIKM